MREDPIFTDTLLSPVDIDRTPERVPVYPATLWGKAAYTLEYVRGVLGMAVVRLRCRKACAAAQALGDSLEGSVFPIMRNGRDRHLLLTVTGGGKPLKGSVSGVERSFIGTEALSSRLVALGVRQIVLDARLEAGQVLDACLILYLAQRRLGSTSYDVEHTEPYSGWNRKRMAAALRSPAGLHLRCQSMYLDDNGTYRVEYSYCDLFLTSIVRTFMTRRGRHKDHRRLFGAAPWVGLASAVVLVVPLPLALLSSVAGIALYAIIVVFASISIATLVYTIGSIQYARENYDTLSRELMEQVVSLSRFPEINPNIVAKADRSGVITYLNPAGRHVYDRCLTDAERFARRDTEDVLNRLAGTIFPSDYVAIAASAFAADATQEREYRIDRLGRVIQYTFTPFPDDKAVIIVGVDVTELRLLNEDLEARVRDRTAELRQTQDVTIMSLAGLAESRDPETGKHLERTRWYVRLLAEALGRLPDHAAELDEETIGLLFKSAPLHDIGKVGIPDRILLKPGKLNEEEFAVMKTHTTIGASALRRALEQLGEDSFLGMGEQIARYHHERWDGSGYPHGLSGTDIPLPARLMAVADVYDALTSRRVYKDAFSHEAAKAIILKERGRHFDPDVVDHFLKVEQRFIEIKEAYVE